MCRGKAPVVEAALVKWIDNAWSLNGRKTGSEPGRGQFQSFHRLV